MFQKCSTALSHEEIQNPIKESLRKEQTNSPRDKVKSSQNPTGFPDDQTGSADSNDILKNPIVYITE